MSPPPAPGAARPRIPAAIWTLGLVSMLTDLGAELVHGLLPVYLAGTLGVGMLAIGLIEGGAEGLALAVKVYSGWLSDAVRRRRSTSSHGPRSSLPGGASITTKLRPRLATRQ